MKRKKKPEPKWSLREVNHERRLLAVEGFVAEQRALRLAVAKAMLAQRRVQFAAGLRETANREVEALIYKLTRVDPNQLNIGHEVTYCTEGTGSTSTNQAVTINCL